MRPIPRFAGGIPIHILEVEVVVGVVQSLDLVHFTGVVSEFVDFQVKSKG